MAYKITLRTIEDIKKFRNKITNLNIQLLEFQTITITKLANEIITSKILHKMKSAGFSEKIIKETRLDRIDYIGTRKIRLHFVSDYFSEDGTSFDVSLAREIGTKRHFIKPVKKLALYGGKKWPFFSKGHWVSGIPAYHIIRDTVKAFAPYLQEAYNKEQDKWYAKNLEGVAVAS